jgi:ATP/maltotriose-dependent transcriptional regulator MalT
VVSGLAAGNLWLRGVGEEDPEGGASAGAVLHRRAAAWYRQAGNLEEAGYHATASGESTEAHALTT